MIETVSKLVVKYNDRTVGYLAELEENRIGFQYDSKWTDGGFSISPFSLPLSREIFINRKTTFNGLYGVFNDSLPDGWGELLVKRMLAKKGINYDRLDPLTKLALVSGNGLGGLTFEPSLAEKTLDAAYDLDALAQEVRKIFDDGNREDVDLDTVFRLGGSSGGARPKAHIKVGQEDWIVKYPCRIDPDDAGEKEFAANTSAKKCGIHVNEYRLFPSSRCAGYFGAKRFDRCGGKRVHMISLSALLETTHRLPNLDYLHLFQVIQTICADKGDLLEAYRRMVFNVLYGNKDDHGKNFSFLYDEELGGYKLSPAYDLTKTPDKLEHEMTVNGNGRPTENNLLEAAAVLRLPGKKCKKIVEDMKQVMEENGKI